jgi:hypothetical protein
MAKKKLTPKQLVLEFYPNAFAFCWAGPQWTIYAQDGYGTSLNLGAGSAKQAWEQAAAVLALKPENRPWWLFLVDR